MKKLLYMIAMFSMLHATTCVTFTFGQSSANSSGYICEDDSEMLGLALGEYLIELTKYDEMVDLLDEEYGQCLTDIAPQVDLDGAIKMSKEFNICNIKYIDATYDLNSNRPSIDRILSDIKKKHKGK